MNNKVEKLAPILSGFAGGLTGGITAVIGIQQAGWIQGIIGALVVSVIITLMCYFYTKN